jgi:Mg-chelatase subunit ChlD
MVFVLDTTGSMGGLIEGAKQKIWSIVNEVMQLPSSPSVRVGLVAYRDKGDQYVTKLLPVTNDLDLVYTTLMDYRAGGGGDTPENVRRALTEGVNKAGWSQPAPGIAQILFLVGDAPPHEDYDEEPSTLDSVKQAIRAGIIVNTIQCGEMQETKPVWKTIASSGQGRYFAIAQDGGVQAISTPYDKPLAELGAKLGSTFVAYGGGRGEKGESFRAMTSARQSASEVIAANATPSAAADRAVNKVVNKDAYVGDLLQSIENGSIKIDSITEDDLPNDLRSLSAVDRKVEIEKRLAERRSLRDQIVKLSKERDSFMLAERKKTNTDKTGFDVAVASALKEQLASKGIK